MEVLNVTKSTKKETKDEKPTLSLLFRFLMRCMSFSQKVELSNEGPWNQTHHDKCKAAGDAGKDYPRSPVASSPSLNSGGNISPALSNIGSEVNFSSQLRQFSFSELKHATRNFRPQSVIGEGGFGRVYKGWVNEAGPTAVKPGTGLAVAVKNLNHEGRQGHREWLAEVNYLSKLHHPNLVKLVGFCIEGDQRLLVYEFMARGSLENHLFRRGHLLPWSVRIKIALDAAKGLAYLHEEAVTPVIYRDFKASNILLDADFNAKLSDFGLAKDGPEGDKTHVSTRVMGTFGYAAPEYIRTGHLTAKSDIYTFGIVLLEILSGRKSVDRQRSTGSQNLLDWAWPYLRDKKQYLSVMDPNLHHCFPVEGARKAVQLAVSCIRPDPKARPLMSQVVKVLKTVSELTDYPQTSPLIRNKSPFRSPQNSFRSAATPTNRHQPKSPRNALVLSGRPSNAPAANPNTPPPTALSVHPQKLL